MLLAVVAVFLAVVSLLPGQANLYTSVWAVALWGATAFCAIIAIARAQLWRHAPVFILHIALLLILAGAMLTHVCGESEQIHLRVGETHTVEGCTIRLDDFVVEYYPATSAPSDFVAQITIDGRGQQVSMNHTASAAGLRILLASCDSDRLGCKFTISKDVAGTSVSYAGYLMLLIAMMAVSFKPGRRVIAVAASLLVCASMAASPRTVPKPVADAFGDLYVYHNDRVAPFSTLARDFAIKLYGTDCYEGLTPEQVIAGWLFYYDDWKTDPGIKIKDKKARAVMGLQGNRARLTDFFGDDGYLFNSPDYAEANEKFALASAAAAGSIWRLYPLPSDTLSASASVVWHSPVDELPAQIDVDSWRMTRHSLSYLAELIAGEQWQKAIDTVHKIGEYQKKKCARLLPSANEVMAERIFLRLSGSLVPIILLIACGIFTYFYAQKALCRCLLVAAMAWIALLIGLNAYASGHLPMSNGYETMQWLALLALAVCLYLGRKQPAIMPLGMVVAAMALAVSLMGQRNPQLTNMMPVLKSPLLSIHVLTMMLAYALLSVMALISIMYLLGRRELIRTARLLLRPAVFLLAAGIFIGAVWANASWGRYWGWDPKEVWALIAMIVYSFPLHAASLPMFRSNKVFAIWTSASFLVVVMTYFGVNYFLGGLHSYA